jgi:peptidoglycan/xylan/chitin deacetylase (PgdA/CDA1 family)
MIGPLVTYSTHASALRKFLSRVLAIAEPLSVEDFVTGLDEGTLPSRFVVITFDDGYRDTLEIAKPLLTELGVPFAVFLTTGFVDRVSLPVEIELGRHFESRLAVTKWTSINRMLAVLSGRFKKLSAQYEAERGVLKGASTEERTRVLRSLRADHAGDTFDLFLTWEDVRALAKSPLVTLGAHGHEHLDLTAVAAVDAESEISVSRRRISEELGAAPEFYCFAYGSAKEEHLKMVERAGFRAAFGIGSEIVSSASFEPYRIPRIDISDTDSVNRRLALLETQ